MDITNEAELAAWADGRLRMLDAPPSWEPNAARARARIEARLRTAPKRGLTWAAIPVGAGALAALLVLISPDIRATAAQLWRTITMSRIDVVRVDFDDLPDEASSLEAQTLVKPGPPTVVNDIVEAQARVGFVPRLPQGILGSPIRLSTMDPLTIGTVLKASDVELALTRAGATDEIVPPEWDGARLALRFSGSVMAEWPGISLTQSLPPALETPPQFDFGSFTRMMLRAAGMRLAPAERYGQRMAAAPALLFGVGAGDDATIREVELDAGPAIVMESVDDDGKPVRMELLWTVADRAYLLSGHISQDRAVAIANAVR